MNLAMQQPLNYPFYMGPPQSPYPYPWPSNAAYHYPSAPVSYPLPFILSHQPRAHLPAKPFQPTFSPYTNTRYNHLKQSTSHVNRYRSIDPSTHSVRQPIPNYQYRPVKTKSVSDFHQLPHPNSTHLLKAHSWHSMQHLHQPNAHVNYSKPIPFAQNNPNNTHYNHHHRHSSPKRKERPSHKRNCSSSSSTPLIPEQGLVRISTYETMPVMHNPIYQGNTFPNDKLKTSISTNSHRQSSPSSTASSQSSLQKRLNGSLRHDPLLNAAMEDFRQLRRTSSQSTSFTVHKRDISRDSLCSNSSHHSSSSPSSSSARSRSQSQSSFTSLERLEIRHLMKALKAKGLQDMNTSAQLFSSPPPSSQRSSLKQAPLSSANKPQKSSITEELDEEFQKIRSSHPNEDLVYIKPSLIQKRKQSIAALPTFEELLEKVQKQTSKKLEEKASSENSILPIPVVQKKSDPSSRTLPDFKPEYAVPIKKSSEIPLRPPKKDEQMRSFSFCKPINDLVQDTTPSRPASMFNWLQYGLTNPLPSTFQSRSTSNNHDKSLVKENIYASDIEIHLPLSNEKEYLNNPNLMKDYLFDYKEQSTSHSSIFNDFSRLFTRSANPKRKSKLHKTKDPHQHHPRCSIM